MIILVSPAVLFFLWMLSLSLKNELDNTAYPPVFIPHPPTLDNFIDVFAKNDFLRYTINSVIVSFSATGLALLLGVPAGYGIAKTKATKAAVLILIARVTPGLSYLIPLFLLFQWLRPARHADAAGHHPSGDHRADRGVGHDRLSSRACRANWRKPRWWTAPRSGRRSAMSRCRWRGPGSWWR